MKTNPFSSSVTTPRRASALRFAAHLALLMLATSPEVFAAEGVWSATSGTWNTSNSNWTGVTGTPWDSTNGGNNTANFTSTSGSATVSGTVYANQITYTAASGSFAINSGTVNLAGTTPTISVNPSRTLTIGSTLDGSAGLTKNGTGTLTLSGSNSYSGNTTINGGTLDIRNNNALGSTADGTTISTNGILQLQGGITVSGENLVHNGGSGGYIYNLSGNNAWNGNITIGVAGSRIASDAGLLTIGGNVTLNGGVAFQGTSNTTISGTISGTNQYLSLNNSMGANAVVTLSGNNTYTGASYAYSGTLSVNSIKNIGSNSSLGTGTGSGASIIYLGGTTAAGTLQYTGAGDTTDRRIQVGAELTNGTGGAVIRNNGSGALVFTNAAFNNV
jgi:fibronectin-binding autotransporter adhesin